MKIETYDNMTVGRENVQAPYANAESFGGGIARQTQQSGQMLSSVSGKAFDIAEERKDEYDANKVLELDTALSDFSRAELNENIYNREGKNALGSFKEFQEKVDDKIKTLLEQTENSAQAQSFSRLAKSRRSSYLDSTASFERVQFQKYKQENTKAVMTNAVDDALANYTNKDLVQMSYNKGLAALRSNYFGQGDEILRQKEMEYKTDFYKPMISKLSAEDAEQAEAYFGVSVGEVDTFLWK